MLDDFAYFTIRVRLAAPDDGALMISGVIEDLSTGVKQEFGSGEELLRVVHTRGTAASDSVPRTSPNQ